MTVPLVSLMVITPAAPLFAPMVAKLPLSQGESSDKFDQFAAPWPFQLPEPSVGVAGFAPLESQIWPAARPANPLAKHDAIARVRICERFLRRSAKNAC